MKTQRIFDEDAPKRPVNLTANADLLSLAKGAGINLSKTFEEAILGKVRVKLEEQWLAENQEAIATYNARVEKHGVFGASKRRF